MKKGGYRRVLETSKTLYGLSTFFYTECKTFLMPRSPLFLKASAFLWLHIISVPAFSWYDTGHRVVALLAETGLTQKARKQVQDILPAGTTLADAAVWPDHEGRSFNDLDPLHYVSIDEAAPGYDQSRDCPKRDCMVEALGWFIAALGDRTTPMMVKRIALRYVVHLMGDMHQPLHAGRARDRGGTLITVSYRGKTTNLHYFWDSDLVDLDGVSVEDIVERLSRRINDNAKSKWQAGGPIDWTNESLRLARSHAYALGDAVELSDRYVENARPIVRTRLLQAAVRLTWVLNRILR